MKLKDFPVYRINPFRANPNSFRVISNTKETVLSEHGEVLGHDKKLVLADFQEHLRIFNYNVFVGLSSSANMILWYIAKNVPKGADEVLLSPSDIMSSYSWKSRTAVYSGILELIDKNIIARRVGGDLYYINPDYLFKGSRAKWYDSCIEIDEQFDEPKIRTYI